MRILQINMADRLGGAEDVGYRLHTGYRERGHESKMAVGYKRSDDPDVAEIPNLTRRPRVARALQPLETRLRQTEPNGVRAARVLAVAGDPRRFAEVLRGHEDFDHPGTAAVLDLHSPPPDVVQAHNLHGGYFDLRQLPEIAARRPLLLTLHDQWMFTGHCAHPVGHERWREGCGNCPALGNYPAIFRDETVWNLERKRAIYERMTVRVSTPSRWLMERVQASVLAAAVIEARVIPNGIDMSVFSPGDPAEARASLGLPLEGSILMFAANRTRSNPYKDYATLNRMVDVLGERGRALTVVCVGEEAPDRRSGSVTLRNVEHQGAPESLVPFYRSADVYVHATKADTFPTTVLEALACGTPVVATAVGGIPEQVDEGVTGLLVPAGDAVALADRAEGLLDDEDGRLAMGERAAAAAHERFRLGAMVDAYEDWLGEIVAESRA